MAKFSASSLFSGINAGAMNSYAILSNLYSDGLTQKNLTSAMCDKSVITSGYGTTFASYLSQNFANIDTNDNGVLSNDEVQSMMSQMSTQGLTRAQITQLGGMSGISADTQGTILDHFDQIDKNHDGYVNSAEVQAYIIQSKLENRKNKDMNESIGRTSLFYGDDSKDTNSTSMMSYKWLQDDTQSS